MRSIARAVIAALIGILTTARAPAQDREAARFAFLVGVQNYSGDVLRPLEYTWNDVEGMASALQVLGFPESRMVVMSERRGADPKLKRPFLTPTEENIQKQLDQVLQRLPASGALLLVGLAGHGVQFSGSDEVFFCPQDARVAKTLAKSERLVSIRAIYEQLDQAQRQKKAQCLLVIDACRVGPDGDGLRAADRDAEEIITPQKLKLPGGLLAVFSCSAGQRSFESRELQNGVFFHYLIEGLRGGADANQDGTLRLFEALSYVTERTSDWVADKHGELQIPQLVSSGTIDLPLGRLGTSRPKPVSGKLTLRLTGATEALVCDALAYEATVSNTSSGVIRDIRIEDKLPEGLVAADGLREVSFVVKELAPGESRTFPIGARASRSGTFINSLTASAEGGISAASNSISARVTGPALDIAIDCPSKCFGSGLVEYKLAITNRGDGVGAGTVVESSIPVGCTFEAASDGGRASDGKVVWALGVLNPGQSRNLMYAVRSQGLGIKTAAAAAECVCSDPATASCTTEVKGIPSLRLELNATDAVIPVGGETTYILTVSNRGSADDGNVSLTCELENDLEFVSCTGATQGVGSGGTVTFAPLGVLSPKEVAEWRVVVRGVGTGDLRFRAEVRSENQASNRPIEKVRRTQVYQ